METKEKIQEVTWNATFTHTDRGVEVMTCDFGNGVRVLVDFPNETIQKKFGEVTVDEHPIDYFDSAGLLAYLADVAFEIMTKG